MCQTGYFLIDGVCQEECPYDYNLHAGECYKLTFFVEFLLAFAKLPFAYLQFALSVAACTYKIVKKEVNLIMLLVGLSCANCLFALAYNSVWNFNLYTGDSREMFNAILPLICLVGFVIVNGIML